MYFFMFSWRTKKKKTGQYEQTVSTLCFVKGSDGHMYICILSTGVTANVLNFSNSKRKSSYLRK